MHREGHIGVAFLLYAPLAFLLSLGNMMQPAVLGMVGTGFIAMAPDLDMDTSLVKHRGITHTVLAAGVTGLIYAVIAGWMVWTGISTQSSTQPAIVIQQHWLATIAGSAFGFLVGSLAITAHLLGDTITPMGIRPWQPFNDKWYSLKLVRAKNETANRLLFLVGTGATITAIAAGTSL